MNTIRELRGLAGLTQKDFAEKFGIPIGTLKKWEYGESSPAPYLTRMIAANLPCDRKRLRTISSGEKTYYYDAAASVIIDRKGTRIPVHVSLDEVKESNLVLYAESLFEEYYAALEKFENNCRVDKSEGILWG